MGWDNEVRGRSDARKSYGSDQQFRAEYLSSVQEYEAIRQKVDSGLDVSNTIEERAKLKMDGFTSIKELRLGDVIKVPTWTPHSLQHGIRVIEFQTPTYERYIISFEQRVLTQEHWDSEHAIAHMTLDPPAATNYESISEGLERIARFEDFNVFEQISVRVLRWIYRWPETMQYSSRSEDHAWSEIWRFLLKRHV
ncbi:MAG: hypothetical protein Ct9H90mP27_1760 [Gammaproteobacteria bacterium]|nr:MAG: hypothetical protein Ct9H90mP27_1760 [Gammaproteobacteria bacterium]